jgi:hypothetical protein
MTDIRKVEESPIHQGKDESIARPVEWAAIGTPTSPVVVIKNGDLVDTSTTNLSGAAAVVGTTVVTPLVTALVPGTIYRLECKVTISGNVYEAYCEIIGEE